MNNDLGVLQALIIVLVDTSLALVEFFLCFLYERRNTVSFYLEESMD